jgi:hypothetical protein
LSSSGPSRLGPLFPCCGTGTRTVRLEVKGERSVSATMGVMVSLDPPLAEARLVYELQRVVLANGELSYPPSAKG